MRTFTLVATILALSAGLAGAAARPATLRLVSTHPLVLRGSGFHPGERVRVTAHAYATRVVRTTVGGTFRVQLPKAAAAANPCMDFTVSARGALGDRASMNVQPLCAPA